MGIIENKIKLYFDEMSKKMYQDVMTKVCNKLIDDSKKNQELINNKLLDRIKVFESNMKEAARDIVKEEMNRK